MIDTYLVPQTTVTAKGDGPAVDISGAGNPVFLLTLNITGQVEQESLDVTIFGSPDATTFGPKALVAFPQKFYRGQHPMLLDLSDQANVKFLRAHWEVNRWGHHMTGPSFDINITIKEVAPEVLAEVREAARQR